MKKINYNAILCAVLLFTIQGCSQSPVDQTVGGGADQTARSQQKLHYDEMQSRDTTLGELRVTMGRRLSAKYGTTLCVSHEFYRIDIGNALELVDRANLLGEERKGDILNYIEQNSDLIVPLYGELQTPDGVSHALLKLVYSPDLVAVPKFMGCSNGLYLDLTKLGNFTSDDPDDPSNPPPHPTACLVTIGWSGPCCTCDAFWEPESSGCLQSDNCDPAYCCTEQSEKFNDFLDECPEVSPDVWYDDTPIFELPVGHNL